MLILMVLSITSACDTYQCKPSSMEFTLDTCAFKEASAYYLQTCPEGLECIQTSPTNSTCSEPPPPFNVLYPGEHCETDESCISKNCNSNVCVGLPQTSPCNSTSECDIGLYCSQKECTPQMKADSGTCYVDSDCENNLGCYTNDFNFGFCLQYMIMEKTNYIYNCKDNRSLLCETGNCIAQGSGKGICIDPIKSMYIGSKCSEKSDCLGEGNGYKFFSECTCGYNSAGQKYCQPFLGDYFGTKYWELLRNYINSPEILKCHALTRFSDSCMKTWPMYDVLKYYQLKHEMFPLIQDNDECVRGLFTSQYWQFDKYAADNALVLYLSLLISILS